MEDLDPRAGGDGPIRRRFQHLAGLTDEEFMSRMNISRNDLARLAEHRANLERCRSACVGEPAPDFDLTKLDDFLADGARSRPLSELRNGRPVTLIFGSYTCPVFCSQVSGFNQMYDRFSERIDFFGVYIAEAHPANGWELPGNRTQGIVYDQPQTLEQRAAVATAWVSHSRPKFPIYLDGMQDEGRHAYNALPERLCVIAGNGELRFISSPGPFDDEEIGRWSAALATLLG